MTLERVQHIAVSEDDWDVAFTGSRPADPRDANEAAAIRLCVLDRETGETKSLYADTRVSEIGVRRNPGAVPFLMPGAAEEHTLYALPFEGRTTTRSAALVDTGLSTTLSGMRTTRRRIRVWWNAEENLRQRHANGGLWV